MNRRDSLLERLRPSEGKAFDEQALTEVYDTYNQEIFRYACALLGSADQAEECVAETFSRLLSALKRSGGPRENLRAYLYRVAHNWIVDQRRKAPCLEVPLDEITLAEGTAALEHTASQNPAGLNGDPFESQRLRRALSLLTEDQRRVIGLKFLADFSNEEVAETLRKPVGAVKSLQKQGFGRAAHFIG